MSKPSDPSSRASAFARESQGRRPSFLREYVAMVRRNGKWWMLPLVLILLAFGGLMVLMSTGAAPFLYTLF